MAARIKEMKEAYEAKHKKKAKKKQKLYQGDSPRVNKQRLKASKKLKQTTPKVGTGIHRRNKVLKAIVKDIDKSS